MEVVAVEATKVPFVHNLHMDTIVIEYSDFKFDLRGHLMISEVFKMDVRGNIQIT